MDTAATSNSPSWLFRLRRAGLTFCLFLFVASANWATLDRFGSDMPDWDQYDAEAMNLFAPWFEHDHFVAHLFEPHNEHRVVLTKLQNLAVCLANGQWDARLECVANALLHGLIAVAFWVIGRRWLARRWQAPYYVAIAALYGLPLAWQNLIGGFHSQQYWLIGLSFAAMLLLPFVRVGSGRWWLGIASATFALGSMGSGFLAAAVVFGLLIIRWIGRETTLRSAWPTLAIMTVLIAVGDLTRIEVPYHQDLKAKTAHDFIFSILRSLEWPLFDHDWAGAITWAPWLIVACLVLRARWPRRSRGANAQELSSAALVIFALGGWVLIQLLATAYARGAGANYPASRYMDTLIFATAVNALALGWLFTRTAAARLLPGAGGVPSPRIRVSEAPSSPGEGIPPTSGRTAQLSLYLVGLAWLAAVSVGTYQLYRRNVGGELPGTKNYYIEAENHVRGYLATNDPAELTDPVPYPSTPVLIDRLAMPSVRRLMPQSVRAPLPLKPAASTTTTGTFVANEATQRNLHRATRAGLSPATPALAARPTWGSYAAAGPAFTGEWRSLPLSAPLQGWLKFETAGQIGAPGVSLELRDAATDSVLSKIRPSRPPGDSWRAAYVRAPAKPFVVVARDNDAQRWIAFSAPVEMGTLSYVAWQLAKNGLLLAEIAAGLALLLGLWAAFQPQDVRLPGRASVLQTPSSSTASSRRG